MILNNNAVTARSVCLLDRRGVCCSDGDEAKQNEQLHLDVGDGSLVEVAVRTSGRR